MEISLTKFNDKKVELRLSSEKVDIIREFENRVNEYLEENNIPKVTILYGNRIYPKMRNYSTPEKCENVILKGVFVNNENKPFPQLWLVH